MEWAGLPQRSSETVCYLTKAYNFFNTAAKASIAKWLACMDSRGSPPAAASNSSRRNCLASARLRPLTSAVKSEAHAIEGTHPLARNPISEIRPSTTFTLSLNMSPQAGFSICADPSGCATSPAFRGF